MGKDKKEKISFFRTVSNLWYMIRYVVKYSPFYIVVTLTEAFGRGGEHIIGILFTKYLFDAIERGEQFKTVLFWTLLVASYSVLFELFNKWRLNVYVPRVKHTLHENIQNELYQKARHLDLACYDDPEFYNDFIWAIRQSDGRVVEIMENFSLFINRVITSAVVLGVLASMDIVVTVVLLIAVGLGFVIKNKTNKVVYEQNIELNPIGRKLNYIGRVFYLQDYAKELRQGEIASHLQNEFNRTVDSKIACLKKYLKTLCGLWFIGSLILDTVPSIGVTGYLIIRYVVDPTMSLGIFSASVNASFKLFWTISDIGNYVTKFHEHSLYIEKVRKFIAYEPQIKGEEKNIPPFESLHVKGLGFTYPFSSSDKKILDGIDLEIKKGERIAFVGYNGAGKTTLIKLLMRLYDCSQGEILYNGVNIKTFDPETYRKHIGAVFQDYKVFAATLAENVVGGEYQPEDEVRVMAALKAVTFDEKLKSMPNGIHSQMTTEFSKDGVGLSGGEGQKIAIARAFAQPYDILIMDEPSSALDPIAEYELNRSILKEAENRTVIFISHRLSTTRMADRIYMFDGGRITECGSHDQLMTLNGRYAEMYRTQAKKYRTTEN